MSLRRHIDVLREFVSYGTPCEDWSALSPIGYVDREPSPGQRWLAARGIDTRDHGDDIRRATPEYQEGQRESQRRYASTAKGKAAKKARRRSRRRPGVVSGWRERFLTHNGVTLTVCEWARRVGMPESTLRERVLQGWPDSLALTLPKHTRIARAA